MLNAGTNTVTTVLARLKSVVARKEGSVAVQFALLALPLTVLAFGLFDVNRATVARQQLQDSLDAATLLAARSTATTDAGLDAIGQPALAANLQGYSVSASSFHTNGAAIDASATLHVVPVVSNLWLAGDMTITATSEVIRTINKVEVALVLDNTGSMAQNLGSDTKINALKGAASGLVDTLAAAAARGTDPNAVKFSVVPFSETVNVGPTYSAANWISPGLPAAYGTDNFSTAGSNRFTLLSQMGLSWAGCVESRPDPYDIQDTAPAAGTPASMFVPYFAPDEPDDNKISSGGGNYYTYSNNWITNDKTSSTVHSNRQNNVTKYAASNKANIVNAAKTGVTMGPNRDCGLTPLLRLTTDSAAVKAKLNSLVAVGNTNVAMGAVWGWHTLSPNAPFADGVPYGTSHVDKIVILLTDGDNTDDDANSSGAANNPNKSIYLGLGYAQQGRLRDANNAVLGINSTATQRRDGIDSRELKTCANMKAQHIIIYAIGVGVSSHSKTILQTCATDSSHYFDVTDSGQLSSVFNAIAGSINNLRISK